jgi:pimeloyl-ACP methyl ester carboxylesterase
MARLLIGLLIVLHGLVHLWYVVLSQRLVPFRPEMGWTGRSWLFTPLLGDLSTRFLASALYALAALALVAAGITVLLHSSWQPAALVGAAALSVTAILLGWDGSLERVVEKSLVGLLVSLALIGAVAGTARFRREIQTARAHLTSLDSQIVETNCGPIEYARSGEGYPVLVVHGIAGGFDQGLGLAQSYLDQGFQVIAPSRFGYLRSPLPANATPAQQADAFACLLDALGLQQVAVFGSSAGVTASLQFALRHPDRVSALVLHSPNAPGEVELVLPPKPVYAALLRSDYAFWALTTYFRSGMQSLVGVPQEYVLTPEYEAEIGQVFAGTLPVSARADGMLFDTYVSNPDIQSYPLGRVETPSLVISAIDDPMALHTNARALADQLASAQLMAVPDGGHLLLGHTAAVKSAVSAFLHGTIAGITNDSQTAYDTGPDNDLPNSELMLERSNPQ